MLLAEVEMCLKYPSLSHAATRWMASMIHSTLLARRDPGEWWVLPVTCVHVDCDDSAACACK